MHTDDRRRSNRKVVPPKLRSRLLYLFHDHPLSSHPGQKHQIAAMSSRFYWREMVKDIIEYIETCLHCVSRKSSQPLSSGLMQLFSPTERFQLCYMDILGPFPTTHSGNKYVLVMIDGFTRRV